MGASRPGAGGTAKPPRDAERRPSLRRLVQDRSPWAQAPILLLRFPAVLIAVVAGSFTLALASAAGPLFLSSAGNAALSRQTATVTPWNAGLTVTGIGPVAGRISFESSFTAEDLFEARDRSLRQGVEDLHGLGPPVVSIIGSLAELAPLGAPDRRMRVRPLTRTGALSRIARIREAHVGGMWITQDTARKLRVSPGQTVWLFGADRKIRVRIAGVYRNLASEPLPLFWSSLSSYITQLTPDSPVPAPLALMDQDTFHDVDGRLRDEATFQWEFPLKATPMTLEEGRALAGGLRALRIQIITPGSLSYQYLSTSSVRTLFPSLLAQAEQAVSTLRAPVDAVALAGQLVALTGMAAAGMYWVHRRRVEFRQLIARGLRPASAGVRSILEAAPPAALGAFLGWRAAPPLIRLLGPTELISPGASRTATRALEWGILAGVALLGVVIVLGIRREARPGSEHLRRIVIRAPWEAILLALAGAAFYELSSRGTAVVSTTGEPPKVDKLLVLFPILLIAGGAGLAVRGLRLLLGRFRGVGRRRPIPVFLALRRLAAASAVGLVLVAASALSVGILVYAGAMASSLRATVDAKALTFVGSDVSVLVGGTRPTVPPGLPFPATLVTRIPAGPTLAQTGETAELIGVDPATFAGAAYWDRSFAEAPLPELLARLRPVPGKPIPALLLSRGEVPDLATIEAGGSHVVFRVVGSVRVFPGATSGEAAVIADRRELTVAIERAVQQTNAIRKTFHQPLVPSSIFDSSVQMWARGDPRTVVPALRRAGVIVIQQLTAASVRSSPLILALAWTFGFMQTVALAIGSLALVAVVLYVQARRRSREVAYALARRMGLRPTSHMLSLALELAGLLAAAFGVGTLLAMVAARLTFTRLDPIPSLPPSILLRVPAALLGLTAATLFVAAWIGAVQAQRGVGRMKVGEVMRVGA